MPRDTSGDHGVRRQEAKSEEVDGGRSLGRQASGIYGLIVTAAVLASAGAHLPTFALGVAVFITLVVYWLAEEYAQLVEHANAGDLPSWQHIRGALAANWPMVSASYGPLVALVIARVLGLSTTNAAYVALGVAVAILIYYGWSAGHASGLRGFALVLVTSAAGALGAVMILLKVVIAHLH